MGRVHILASTVRRTLASRKLPSITKTRTNRTTILRTLAHHMKTRGKQSAKSLARRSATMKRRWKDPAFRAKRIASMQGVKRGDGGVKGRRRVRQRAKLKETA